MHFSELSIAVVGARYENPRRKGQPTGSREMEIMVLGRYETDFESLRDAEAGMNIFDRAKELARGGRSTGIIIRTLKAERFENVEAYLSPSFRRELRKIREDATPSANPPMSPPRFTR